MRKFIVFVLLLFSFSVVNARVIHAVANGSWGSSSTWEDANGNNTIPACGDTIIILDPFTVEVNETYNYDACITEMLIYITGIIDFGKKGKLNLPANSIVAIDSGGQLVYTGPGNGGSSVYLSIDGTNQWVAHDGNVTGPILYPSGGVMPVLTELLPIELAELKAELNNFVVNINWTTLTETNNDYFLIEKSADAINYTIIDRVEGAGNSNEILEYSIYDMEPSQGVSYYKLKQVDYDGKFKYFGPVAVNYNKINNTELNIYPNPVIRGNQLNVENIKDIDNTQFIIVDIVGNKIVLNYSITDNSINFYTENFAKGTYILQIKSNNEFHQQKFIVK